MFNLYSPNTTTTIEYISANPTPITTPSPFITPALIAPSIYPTPKDTFNISNIKVKSDKRYIYVVGGLRIGNRQYIDRKYKFTFVPTEFVGLDYIRTANSNKKYTDLDFLSFKINKPSIVYVAYDSRIKSRPGWLKTFTQTNKQILTQNSAPFIIYEKKFNEGTVVLGGNQISRVKSAISNYTIFVKPL